MKILLLTAIATATCFGQTEKLRLESDSPRVTVKITDHDWADPRSVVEVKKFTIGKGKEAIHLDACTATKWVAIGDNETCLVSYIVDYGAVSLHVNATEDTASGYIMIYTTNPITMIPLQ